MTSTEQAARLASQRVADLAHGDPIEHARLAWAAAAQLRADALAAGQQAHAAGATWSAVGDALSMTGEGAARAVTAASPHAAPRRRVRRSPEAPGISVRDAARTLGRTPAGLHRAINEGRIPAGWDLVLGSSGEPLRPLRLRRLEQ